MPSLRKIKRKINKWKKEGYKVDELEEMASSIDAKVSRAKVAAVIATAIIIITIAGIYISVNSDGLEEVTAIFSDDEGMSEETIPDMPNDYDIIFESDVVNLLNYTIEPTRDVNGNIVEVTVNGRIENIMDRILRIVVTAEFYDEKQNYIAEEDYRIYGLRVKPNTGYTTTFTIKYSEEKVDKIDYVKLHAEEIDWERKMKFSNEDIEIKARQYQKAMKSDS